MEKQGLVVEGVKLRKNYHFEEDVRHHSIGEFENATLKCNNSQNTVNL